VFGWIAALGGLALVIGAFLDAVGGSAIAKAAFEATNYMDGDGPIELVLGAGIILLGALLGWGVLPRWGGWIVLAAAVLAAVIAVIDILDVRDSLDKVEAAFGASGSVGPALWVCLVGGVVAAVGGVLAAVSSNDEG
jgi:predicted tellurium resistance membrane protein TerC